MAEQRASIFSDDDVDVSAFKPKPAANAAKNPAAVEQVRAISEAANFRSRDPSRRRKNRHATNSAGTAQAAMFN